MFPLAPSRGTLGFSVHYKLFLEDHSLSCNYDIIFHNYHHYVGTKLSLTVSFRVTNIRASFLRPSIDFVHLELPIVKSNCSFDKTAVKIKKVEFSLAWSDL